MYLAPADVCENVASRFLLGDRNARIALMPQGPCQSLQEFEQIEGKMTPTERTFKKLYRGQGDRFPLLPSLFRPPNSVDLVKRVERELLNRFKKEVPSFMASRRKNDWDWLSLGRHFGLPTRLLDWSDNPHIALFFAVEKNPKSPIVYVYHAMKSQIISDGDKSKKSPFDIRLIQIMCPSTHSARVELQRGWHTVDKIRTGTKTGKEIFVPLEKMEWHDNRIKGIAIDPSRQRRSGTN
jgi:FRG domain